MTELDMIIQLFAGVAQSVERYDAARRKQCRKHPLTGYEGLTNADSKESIQRRITVIREELLKLSKSL